jgi:hypothetical protein
MCISITAAIRMPQLKRKPVGRTPLGSELETAVPDLLKKLGMAVESALPHREPFVGIGSSVSHNLGLRHAGFNAASFDAFPADLNELEQLGYLRYRQREPMAMFDLTLAGWRAYQDLKRGNGKPADSVVSESKLYWDVSGFEERHPDAHDAWSRGAAMLWEADPDSLLTDIGHRCRDATVFFGGSCLSIAKAPEPWPEAKKTKDRISLALQMRVPSGSRRLLLDALFAYWSELLKFSLRQDHGAERGSEHLGFEDARLLVTHALLVMTEIDRACFGPGAS